MTCAISLSTFFFNFMLLNSDYLLFDQLTIDLQATSITMIIDVYEY